MQCKILSRPKMVRSGDWRSVGKGGGERGDNAGTALLCLAD